MIRHTENRFEKIIETPLWPIIATASELGLVSSKPILTPFAPSGTNEFLEQYARLVEEYFKGRKDGFAALELDYTGLSQHQIAVLEQTRSVPFGETASYGDIAHSIGSSARAVGSALRICPFFLAVPAQRIIYANGELGGFGGESRLKEKLLLWEREARKLKP